MDSAANNFYITGVQVEVGSTATSFDYRPYGTELQLCHRYYFQKTASDSSTIYGIPNAYNGDTSNQFFNFWLPVVMRTTPTVTSSGWVGGSPSATYPGTRVITFSFVISTYYMGNATVVTVSAEL